MSTLPIGHSIGGCRVIRSLGRGGMSSIYLARQESVGRDVVLKVLPSSLTGDPTFMTRFSTEVATTVRLQHPHIVPIYDYGEQDGLPYIMMAYLPGGSVDDLIAEGPLPVQEAARIVGQICEALDYAHEMGVIHRDIKPANILLDGKHNAILTDFGIAKVIANTLDLTEEDKIVGTISYLAPELIMPNNTITPAVDIYALGITLYQILTGRLPFDSQSSAQMMWCHVNEPAPLLTDTRPDLSPALDALVQRAMAKSPAARIQSAAELGKRLADIVAGDFKAADESAPETVVLSSEPASRIERSVQGVLDRVVKIVRPDGGTGGGISLPGGQVLTTLHVVDGSPGIFVHFRNGEQSEADVLAADPSQDLALLALRTPPPALDAGEITRLSALSGPPNPGAALVAIGHPLGLDWAVTGGHYNGLHQPGNAPLTRLGINLGVPLVQVDVTINAGNSGGPVIDAEGRLVGLADSIINPAVANNIGFAIYAPAVWRFWQENREAEEPLVAFDCKHHHPAGTQYCPRTGRPVVPAEPISMPTTESIPYTCGHRHPPGLTFCPLIGKPILPTLDDRAEAALTLVRDRPTISLTCSNCGTSFEASLGYCPQCGKPAPA
jgi:serine/threonine protein kinase